MLICCRFWSTC